MEKNSSCGSGSGNFSSCDVNRACLLRRIALQQAAANLIQAQRDYFGAHAYERTDKPRGYFSITTGQAAGREGGGKL